MVLLQLGTNKSVVWDGSRTVVFVSVVSAPCPDDALFSS